MRTADDNAIAVSGEIFIVQIVLQVIKEKERGPLSARNATGVRAASFSALVNPFYFFGEYQIGEV